MSCLFDSLAPAVKLTSSELRKNITDYLETNPSLLEDTSTSDIIKWTEDCDLISYVEKMRNNNTWGGQIEIKAFCNLYKMSITVHVLYTGKKFTTKSNSNALFDINISYNGSHFTHLFTSSIID